ncbi:nuclease-related domain-containing protein [Alkanindiges illinoisensis]|uniref:nuclease-related domain-containing protein n=1 Tax=Alkanindiges illinoisensis TaxID=197183 RepID=UPI00047D267F|nr:nuclease-related domain-containing protein [Alkanindiges illinoisensis]
MLFYIFIFIGLMLVVAYLSSPKFKGKLGEFAVTAQAKKYLGEAYILLNDCTLSDGQNGTTQIDHILLSPYGIFVIETKNYQGWIFGGERQKNWTQKIYKKSFKFQNPLHQNYKHTKVLESVLEDVLGPQYLHSLIVFTPQSTFKTAMPANVVQGRAWIEYVKQFQEEVIPAIKLKRIQYRIEKEIMEKGWKTNRLHVESLKQKRIEPD